jgi:hypothetical protein
MVELLGERANERRCVFSAPPALPVTALPLDSTKRGTAWQFVTTDENRSRDVSRMFGMVWERLEVDCKSVKNAKNSSGGQGSWVRIPPSRPIFSRVYKGPGKTGTLCF